MPKYIIELDIYNDDPVDTLKDILFDLVLKSETDSFEVTSAFEDDGSIFISKGDILYP